MREMRKRLAIGLAAGIFLTAGAPWSFAQRHVRQPNLQQQPYHPPVTGIGPDAVAVDPKAVQTAIMLQNEKEFRQGVEQLSALVNELKEEVEKTPATETLSVTMYKKAQEIEKLAKRLKNKVKG